MCACREHGCNICGEGGEYETLTLDCPLFTHARIVVDEWHMAAEPGAIAAVGTLAPINFHLEPKVGKPPEQAGSIKQLHFTSTDFLLRGRYHIWPCQA